MLDLLEFSTSRTAATSIERADFSCAEPLGLWQVFSPKGKIIKLYRITLSLAMLAMSVAAQAATVRHSVKVGELRCNIAGGLGLIVTSKKTMKCHFKSVKGHSETHEGAITKFGIDIGATNGGILA